MAKADSHSMPSPSPSGPPSGLPPVPYKNQIPPPTPRVVPHPLRQPSFKDRRP